MTPTDDLDRLLSAAADGELSAADQLHLAVLLRDDPAARAAYQDYMILDALLQWEKPQPAPVEPTKPVRPWGVLRRAGWLVAACLLVGIGVGVGLTLSLPTREAAAKSDVVDRLADWNLDIADARTPAERRGRFREKAGVLAAEVARSELPPDERHLADVLFARASALAETDDPVAAAEHLDALADELHRWVEDNAATKPRRAAAVEQSYLRVVERSLAKVARATEEGMSHGQRARVEKVVDRIAGRAEVRAQKGHKRPHHKNAK